MEKKRFGDAVSVTFEIEDTDFELPPFTIQTLVENALTHGIRAAKAEKGSIVIRSRREGTNHTVIDNGAGFDTGILDEYSSAHTGIKNTEQRLSLMCGGNLDIKSRRSQGTTATITVPDKKG